MISPNPFGHVWAIWFLAIDQQNRRKYEVSKEWVQLKPEIPAKNGIQMVIHGVILP
jgi:acyl-homoserine lactone acylase PvdQ